VAAVEGRLSPTCWLGNAAHRRWLRLRNNSPQRHRGHRGIAESRRSRHRGSQHHQPSIFCCFQPSSTVSRCPPSRCRELYC